MKLNKLFAIALFVICSINSVFGTGQIPDYLIIEKDTLSLHCNPLESYFKKNPIKEGIITSMSTGLWRGYIAFFEFKNNKLVVQNIYKQNYITNEKGEYKEELISIYNDIFGSVKDFECNFYDGVLICPFGKIIDYVHMGYSSTYENYRLIEIQKGSFIKDVKMNANEFMELKIKHFEKFKQTEEYKKQLEETINTFREMDKNFEKDFGIEDKEAKKRKRKNKYLYEKEKEAEHLKSAQNFIFIFTTNNIKTIDITN